MNNTRKITTALFTLALLFGTQAVAKKKMDIAKHTQHLAPAEKLEKKNMKLKPKHLYVKSEEQMKREFDYKRQRNQQFKKMKMSSNNQLKQQKMKTIKGDKNAKN